MEKEQRKSSHHSSTPPIQPVEVAAGLIFRDGKLLLTQRHADAHLGGLWEFPGGKREAEETFEQCLVRELREELGVEVRAAKIFESVTHAYLEKTVHVKFFVCELIAGEPQPLACAAVKWVRQAEIGDHHFPAADSRLLAKLREEMPLWDA